MFTYCLCVCVCVCVGGGGGGGGGGGSIGGYTNNYFLSTQIFSFTAHV